MGKDWDAVATAINTRLAELDMNQRELSERSGVSTATLREIQRNYGPKRRSPRLLAAISEGLGWPTGYLAEMVDGGPTGDAPNASSVCRDVEQLQSDLRELRERVARLEGQADD